MTNVARMRLVDLSHAIREGMVTYPGLPGPEIGDHLGWEESHARYAPGTEFRIARISMVANTGTYLDTPAHRYRDGWGLDEVAMGGIRAGISVDLQITEERAQHGDLPHDGSIRESSLSQLIAPRGDLVRADCSEPVHLLQRYVNEVEKLPEFASVR